MARFCNKNLAEPGDVDVMLKLDHIIIWGAGKAAVKRYEWAVFAGYQVLFFVDNASGLWGERIKGVPICPPETVKNYACVILTSDKYFDEIKAQAEEMSYRGRVVSLSVFKREALYRREIDIDFSGTDRKDETSFVFDSYFPEMNWGGTEEWSCMVANALSDMGVTTQMICGMNDKFDKLTNHCLHFPVEDEISMIKNMAQEIARHLPCVFLSHMSTALNAACAVKAVFPDKIKLVIIVHSDDFYYYDAVKYWSDSVDKIVCISRKIYTALRENYGIEQTRLVYHPNPVRIPAVSGRREIHTGPLKVGFAARLAKKTKRAHLLPEIIEECMKRGIDVEFYIAGEGDCLEFLRKSVMDRQWENRVHILGWISPVDMAGFWSRQDIYLNLSDFEGMSLAMLEAMACGAVPVVTDVSGVSDVIEDGKNGFVMSVQNWMDAVNKIEMLSSDRRLLHDAGIFNMQMIRENFDVADYARWMIDTFDDCFSG